MEQHPIPQNISSYQFRLVGDMTLKQFFQVAGGAVVSLIFYSTPLHPLIKWPLIFFFALLGVALAFLPFEDRPLEKWIVAFFRSVYAPTLYRWKKTPVPIKYFRDEAPTEQTAVVEPKLKSYFSETGGAKPSFAQKLDSYEKSFLSGIGSLFGASSSRVAPPAARAPADETGAPETVPIKAVTAPQPPASPVAPPKAGPIPQATAAGAISPFASKGFGVTRAVEFSAEASPPAPPTVANTIVGQVLDAQGKILEAAILEVRDAAGRPVRALRTNKLGHFMVVTPLSNGPYEIAVEKEGFSFDKVRFDALGELIPPIVIRAEAQRPTEPATNNQQPVISP